MTASYRKAVAMCILCAFSILTIIVTSNFRKQTPFPSYIRGGKNYAKQYVYTRRKNRTYNPDCLIHYRTKNITDETLTKIRGPVSAFMRLPPSLMKHYTEPQLDLSSVKYHTPDGKVLTKNKILAATCSDVYPVPNIVHYVLPFYKPKLRFHHLICILSAFHILKPEKVMFWYSEEPRGEYWVYLKSNISSQAWNEMVIMAQRQPPMTIYGRQVDVKEHKADIERLEAVIEFGGIYLDLDVIVLKPFTPLRKYPMTIGKETNGGLCNGVFLASRSNFFLRIWHLSYQFFRDRLWSYNSVLVPNVLHSLFPGYCHVEEESLDRPNWYEEELQMIYSPKRTWNWRKKNYAMHLWYRSYGKEHDFETIKSVNSTLGDMFRHIIYGTI